MGPLDTKGMDNKTVLEALIRAKAAKMGLPPTQVDQMLGVQTPAGQLPVQQLQNEQLSGANAMANLQKQPYEMANLQADTQTKNLNLNKAVVPGNLATDVQGGMSLQDALKKYAPLATANDIVDKYRQAGGQINMDPQTLQSKYNVKLNPTDQALVEKNQADKIAYDKSSAMFNNSLTNYSNLKNKDLGSLGGLVDLPGIGKAIYGKEQEYEKQRNAIALGAKDIFGGQGSGVRVNLPEITQWATLLPSVNKTKEQNAYDVGVLDQSMKARFGKGLDPQILNKYSNGGQAPSGYKFSIQQVGQ